MDSNGVTAVVVGNIMVEVMARTCFNAKMQATAYAAWAWDTGASKHVADQKCDDIESKRLVSVVIDVVSSKKDSTAGTTSESPGFNQSKGVVVDGTTNCGSSGHILAGEP